VIPLVIDIKTYIDYILAELYYLITFKLSGIVHPLEVALDSCEVEAFYLYIVTLLKIIADHGRAESRTSSQLHVS
jgi:hypothetical protein